MDVQLHAISTASAPHGRPPRRRQGLCTYLSRIYTGSQTCLESQEDKEEHPHALNARTRHARCRLGPRSLAGHDHWGQCTLRVKAGWANCGGRAQGRVFCPHPPGAAGSSSTLTLLSFSDFSPASGELVPALQPLINAPITGSAARADYTVGSARAAGGARRSQTPAVSAKTVGCSLGGIQRRVAHSPQLELFEGNEHLILPEQGGGILGARRQQPPRARRLQAIGQQRSPAERGCRGGAACALS